MTNQVSKKYVDVHDIVPHYTVDRVNGLDHFVINLYLLGRGQQKECRFPKRCWVPLEGLHTLLRKFDDAGYIADRIAF